MGRKAAHIDLSETVVNLLEKELQKRSLEKHYYDRLQIILECSKGIQNKDIARAVGCAQQTVGVWRSRWSERTKGVDITLSDNNDKLKDRAIVARVKELLSDDYRSGAPARLTEEEKVLLQALACESPETYGLPFSAWTHEELSKQAKKMGIDISPSYYGVLLKKRITPP